MTNAFLEHILEQLRDVDALRTKAMFGGHGLYVGDTFFAIVYDDRLYFRTDDDTRPDYEAAEMRPFRPNERQTLRNHLEVPPDVIEDREALEEWAHRAVEAGD